MVRWEILSRHYHHVSLFTSKLILKCCITNFIFIYDTILIDTYSYYLRKVWVCALSAEGPLNSTTHKQSDPGPSSRCDHTL